MVTKLKLTDVHGAELNPRKIAAKNLQRLVDSILEFPVMMQSRPLVLTADHEVIGGNQRMKALCLCTAYTLRQIEARLRKRETFKAKSAEKQDAILKFWKEWIEAPFCFADIRDDYDEEDAREFMIKDNASAGEYDLELLAATYDTDVVGEWIDLPAMNGVDAIVDGVTDNVPDDGEGTDDYEEEPEPDEEKLVDDDRLDFYREMAGDRIYTSDNELEIPSLLLAQQPVSGLELPFAAWGSQSRKLRANVATYHFYVDDYRFNALWKNPIDLLSSGCRAIVEPNCSCHDQTPIAYGLSLIYKKRYLARYFQECGIKVYADLNVAPKFNEYNKLGIPKGYNAFATRGAGEWLEQLDMVLETAKEISGLDVPNLLVYGGGDLCKKFCREHGVQYVEQFINNVDHQLKKLNNKC